MRDNPALPYWRLSAFYFVYFASLGVIMPYWGLYLKAQGYSPQAIGELVAVIMSTKIISPYLLGWIADHTGRGMLIVRYTSVLTMLGFVGVFFADDFWTLVLVSVVFSFFWNAVLPQFEVATMNYLEGRSYQYSAIRLWGSLGFIIAVVGIGEGLRHVDVDLVPVVVMGLFSAIVLAGLSVPERPAVAHTNSQQSISQILAQPVVVAILVVFFLLQLSHGPYYTFYTIYLESQGYSSSLIGWLWALGVIAEIGVFLLMQHLFLAIGPRLLLLMALLLAAGRWLIIGFFVETLPALLFAQLLHAASFGVCHAVAIFLIHRHFTGQFQGRGQALYASLSFGVGGAMGSLGSGYLWEAYPPVLSFAAAAVAAMLAFLVAWRYVRL